MRTDIVTTVIAADEPKITTLRTTDEWLFVEINSTEGRHNIQRVVTQIIVTDDLQDQLRRIVWGWDHEDESAVHDALHVNESVFASLDSARGH